MLSSLSAQEASIGQFGDWLTGSYSKEEPAESGDDFVDERVEIIRIWTHDDDIWLYYERFPTKDKKNPSSQEIWRLDQDGKNKFSIVRSDFPDRDHFVGAYKKTSEFELLDRKEIRRRKGCELRMIFAEDKFMGNNHEPCDPIAKDAAIETFEVEVGNGKLKLKVQNWTDLGEYIRGPKEVHEVFVRKN